MRFMMIVKATRDSEAGVMPEEELIAEMGADPLAHANILFPDNWIAEPVVG